MALYYISKMFKQNKYTKWYLSIIERARSTQRSGYVENHHIIPLCMGGDKKDKTNIVALSAREHLVCHMLLLKMVDGQIKYKLAGGLHRMIYSNPGKRKLSIPSRHFALAREQYARSQSERMKQLPRTKQWNENIGKASKGRIMSAEQKLKISISNSGENHWCYQKTGTMTNKKHSDESREKMSKALSGENHPMFGKKGESHYNFGRKSSRETKAKLSLAQTGKVQTDEHKTKRLLALKEHHARKRAEKLSI